MEAKLSVTEPVSLMKLDKVFIKECTVDVMRLREVKDTGMDAGY